MSINEYISFFLLLLSLSACSGMEQNQKTCDNIRIPCYIFSNKQSIDTSDWQVINLKSEGFTINMRLPKYLTNQSINDNNNLSFIFVNNSTDFTNNNSEYFILNPSHNTDIFQLKIKDPLFPILTTNVTRLNNNTLDNLKSIKENRRDIFENGVFSTDCAIGCYIKQTKSVDSNMKYYMTLLDLFIEGKHIELNYTCIDQQHDFKKSSIDFIFNSISISPLKTEK